MKLKLLLFIGLTLSLQFSIASGAEKAETKWGETLKQSMSLLGHRNMIIVADSAYPLQTGKGVKVIATGADHQSVVKQVCESIKASKAVRPLIALDSEFAYVPEEHAPGAAKLRQELMTLLKGSSKEPIREALHADLLKEVAERSVEYQVVVFKTTGTVPYSSVFFTLDCGYWSAEAEKDLRAKMSK